MTRTSFRPMAAVGLVAAVLAYVGCARTPETAGPTAEAGPGDRRAGRGPPPKAEPAEAEKLAQGHRRLVGRAPGRRSC